MSEAVRQPFAKIGPGKIPMPPWLKVPLFGVVILGSVSALTWYFVVPHKPAQQKVPTTDWSAGSPLKVPAETGAKVENKPDETKPKPDVPGPTGGAEKPFHPMQVWGSDGGNAPIVFNRSAGTGAPGNGYQAGYPQGGRPMSDQAGPNGAAPGNSEYASMLTPTKMHETEAGVRDDSLLLPESKSFECVPDGPQDNQYPGGISCTVGENVWSADGSNILIDKFATVSGQITRGQDLGNDRGFILFTKVRSKHVYAELNSPATDELGQIGVDGIVNEHWWQRIKAATLLTGIQTTGNVAQNLAAKGGSNYLNFNQEQSMASQALQHDINIRSTFWRGQGWPLRIYVQHDIQFKRAYNNMLVAGMK